MELVLSGHSAYHLKYHVIWTCKYRRKVLKPGVVAYLEKLLPSLLKQLPGVSLETIGFDRDHVHMVIVIPPKYSIADVMRLLKSQSARELRKKFAWLDKVYWAESGVFWSPGYFVSSVGASEATVKKYVRFQGRQDSGQKQRKLFL